MKSRTILFTRDPRYQELAQMAAPLISGAGREGISGKNYIGPRNISEIRAVVEGSVSEPEPVIGVGEPPAWYSDQQVSQEPGQTTGFSIIMTGSPGRRSGRLSRKR